MKTMKLASGRETFEIQRDGYSEVLLVGEENSLMTDAEWNEYATRTAKDNSIRMKREREERRARNLAAFNRDRLTVRA
jgi:hypothetical protein